MEGFKKAVMWLLAILLVLSPIACNTPVVEAASSADEKVQGMSDTDIMKYFPPDYNIIGMVDWNIAWEQLRGPGTPGRAPSEAEIFEMYMSFATKNGLIFVDENAKKVVVETGKNGGKVTLIPAVYTATGALAMVGTGTLKLSGAGFTLSGAALGPAIVTTGTVLVGAVIVAGVVYLAYTGYVYAKTHTSATHAPDSLVGRTRLRTLTSTKGKGPNDRCFKFYMNYKKNGTQAIRYGLAQKIAGSNHGNSWLLGVFEGNQWVTVYPYTGDIEKTSVLTEFVEAIACSAMPKLPPIP